jgi:hypothetical protein
MVFAALTGAAVAGVLLLLAALLLVHLLLTLAQPLLSGNRDTRQHDQQRWLVGAVAGFASSLTIGFVVALLMGNLQGWPFASVAVGLPLGCVTGWAVASGHEARLWATQRHSVVLGRWRSGPFALERPYTVTHAERLRHMVCTGATGSGKSTLIRNLVVQDLRQGEGVCVIDPKDDLIDGILAHVPENRVDDVILFDITDTERPLGFNPLAGVAPEGRSLAASELISAFRRYFADAWGARLEHVLRNVLLALLEVPGATLVDVPRILLDAGFRERALRQVSNPAVRDFFILEYEQVLRRRADVAEPILNKVGPWLSYPELRAIIGQSRSAFEVREVMDRGSVLLVRIPQGAFGEDISTLLGSLVVAKLQLAAQSRVNLPPAGRRPFFLYVDEFQNFATSSFSRIASESRAFAMGICAANQYPEQLSRELQLSLQRNAATFVQAVRRRGSYRLEVTRQEDSRDREPLVYELRPAGPLPSGDQTKASRIRERSRFLYGTTDQKATLWSLYGGSSDAYGRRPDLDEQ